MIMTIFLLPSVAATWQVALLIRRQSIADDLQCRLLHNSDNDSDDDGEEEEDTEENDEDDDAFISTWCRCQLAGCSSSPSSVDR